MRVVAITKFKYNGIEFDTLKDVKNHVENIIGEEVLDKITKTCPLEKHRDYIKLLEIICSPAVRKVLLECLNVKLETEDEDGRLEIINVLDIN